MFLIARIFSFLSARNEFDEKNLAQKPFQIEWRLANRFK